MTIALAIERISESGGIGFDACCGVDHADLCCCNVNYQLQTRPVSRKGREEVSSREKRIAAKKNGGSELRRLGFFPRPACMYLLGV